MLGAFFLFVVLQWRAGKMTAVEAMKLLGMSRSNFYRRVKEVNLK